jgi:hypothetical protein
MLLGTLLLARVDLDVRDGPPDAGGVGSGQPDERPVTVIISEPLLVLDPN